MVNEKEKLVLELVKQIEIIKNEIRIKKEVINDLLKQENKLNDQQNNCSNI